MWNIACALGAAVTTCETGQSPSPTAKMSVSSLVSRYETNGRKSRAMSTGSAASYSSSLSSSSSGDVTTQGFYCKSTLPYVGRHMNDIVAVWGSVDVRQVWVFCLYILSTIVYTIVRIKRKELNIYKCAKRYTAESAILLTIYTCTCT